MVLVINFGFFARSMTQSLGEALLLTDIMYLDGTFLPALFLVSMIRAFNLKCPRWFKVILFSTAFAHLVLVWVGCKNGMYYLNPTITITPNGTVLTHTPGPLKFLHFVFLGFILAVTIGLLIFGLFKRERVSKIVLFSQVSIFVVLLAFYGLELVLHLPFEIMPVLYMLGVWTIVFSYRYTKIHNIDVIVNSKYDGLTDVGYVAFDLKGHFLTANRKALAIFPDLQKIPVDGTVTDFAASLFEIFGKSIEDLKAGNQKAKLIKLGTQTYRYEVSYFNIKRNDKKDGILFEFSDDTERQRYLEFVEHYNDTLQKSVKEKSKHITEIQQKIVLGLSEIVENRDSNTGGHVKRTSDIVKILVKTLSEIGKFTLKDNFIEDVIRAAPMHDLGKIAVDNSILCKPSRLTEEEFSLMKTHAPKSAEIVHSILDGVEEEHFVLLSSNLARHHHERWDGKGYPDGLAGNQIPLEARIMAIADVYDALVSKRCYKEPMSFEQAYDIIIENMGSQFDPNLQEVFEKSRVQLEEYYTNIN